MRILLVSPVAERVHIQLIPAALAKLPGVELTIACPLGSLREGGRHESGFRCFPIQLREANSAAKGFDTVSLNRLIRGSRPDIIQVWGGAPDEPLAQVIWGKMRAHSRARIVYYGFNNLPLRWERRTRVKWKVLWSMVAGGIEANSEGIKVMRDAGFRKPLERIFWGISTEEFYPMACAGLRRCLGFDGERIVGYVGRFVQEKGLRELLCALCKLPKSVHCLLIGDGPLRAELELWATLPELKGRVRLLPTMQPDRLAEHMNCMDVLALPSLTTEKWKEQYGRVIGEAFACGVPVVGSDSGAIPEVIGDAGIVVPEGQPSALAGALESAIYDAELRARLASAGPKRAKEELSIPTMAQRLLDFYAHLQH